MSMRQRGVVLTDYGKKRLEAAIEAAQQREKYGSRFTMAELAERAQLSSKTIKKIFDCQTPIDESSIRHLFKAFDLQLEASDYGYSATASNGSTNPKYSQKQDDSLNSLTSSEFDTTNTEALESKIIEPDELSILQKDLTQTTPEIRKRCCSKILQLYSEIQLLNRRKIKVDKLYVDTFLLDRLSADSFMTVADLIKSNHSINSFDRLGLGSQKERVPGLDIAIASPRLMILGKPGAGKSTFLKFLAIMCSQKTIFPQKIPILIELKHLESSGRTNIKDAIYKEMGLKNEYQAESIFEEGNLLLLLDGLDEVSQKLREKIQKDIEIFVQSYHKNCIVLTCRTQVTEYFLDKFTYVEVANFNAEQIGNFSKNWFVSELGNSGINVYESFMEKLYLPENRQTAELAVTPILLSLICWVYSGSRDLPKSRYKLYEDGLGFLLKEWDKRRGISREAKNDFYKLLSHSEKQKMLSFIAFRKFEANQRVLFDVDEICMLIAEFLNITDKDAYTVLSDIESQHGIIVERAQGIYSFSHLTFQEFFAAKAITEGDWVDAYQTFKKNFSDQDWHEVILLSFSMLKKPDDLLLTINRSVASSVLNNLKLKEFLVFVGQKISCSRNSKKLGILRADYLKFALEIIPYLERLYDLGFLLSQSVIENTNRSFVLDDNFFKALNVVSNEIRRKLQNSYNSTIKRDFVSLLELLGKRLPHLNEAFLGWWLNNGFDWIQDLKKILDEYVGISQYWRLTQQEKELISKYSYSNQLIISCIRSSEFLGAETKQIVEESLLDTGTG